MPPSAWYVTTVVREYASEDVGRQQACRVRDKIKSWVPTRSLSKEILYMASRKPTNQMTNSLTNPMKHDPSWEANKFSSTLEIFRILRNPKFHYRIHNSPSLPPILRHINPVHALSFNSLRSIIMLISHLRLGIPSGRFLSDFLINTHHAFLFFLAPPYQYRLNPRNLISISRLRRGFEVPFYLFQDVADWADPKSAQYIRTYCVTSTLLAAEVQRILHETLLSLNIQSVTTVMLTVEPTDSNVTDTTDSQLGAADVGMM